MMSRTNPSRPSSLGRLAAGAVFVAAVLGSSLAMAAHRPGSAHRVEQLRGSCYASGLRSPKTDVKAAAHFSNKRNTVLNLFWVDFDGNRKFYKTLTPGETWDVDTYFGHVWIVTNSSGGCTSVWMIDRVDGTYIAP